MNNMLPKLISSILIGLSIAAPVQKAADLHEPMTTIGSTTEYGMKVIYKFPKSYLDHHNIKIIDNRLVEDMDEYITPVSPLY